MASHLKKHLSPSFGASMAFALPSMAVVLFLSLLLVWQCCLMWKPRLPSLDLDYATLRVDGRNFVLVQSAREGAMSRL